MATSTAAEWAYRARYSPEAWAELRRRRKIYQAKRQAQARVLSRLRKDAEEIYRAEMREYVIRRHTQGASTQQIAKELGQRSETINKYRRRVMQRAIERYARRSRNRS